MRQNSAPLPVDILNVSVTGLQEKSTAEGESVHGEGSHLTTLLKNFVGKYLDSLLLFGDVVLSFYCQTVCEK